MLVGEPGAIIGGEEDEGIFGESLGAQGLQHAAHAVVDFFNDVAIEAPAALAVEFGGGKEGHMGHGVGQVEKEGPRFVLANKLGGLFGVAFGDGGLVGGPFDFFLVAEEGDVEVAAFRRAKGRAVFYFAIAVHVVAIGDAEIGVETVAGR